jgi:hypothetical protein
LTNAAAAEEAAAAEVSMGVAVEEIEDEAEVDGDTPTKACMAA